MMPVPRDADAAATRTYDVAIVGGGIYGAMLLLEATHRGMRALLIEKNDFGEGTSLNNLRIVHGGLRYLQSMHLTRFRESVAERAWFLANFPDLVSPLPCLMPLYGGATRSPLLLRAALFANDRLSAGRNVDVPAQNHLPNGRVLSADETRERYPGVRSDGLRGGAEWFDAVMPDCRRILIESIVRACGAGGTALNQVEVCGIRTSGEAVDGIVARDRVDDQQREFRVKGVINATGPDVDRVNRRLGLPGPDLFIPSLAWNLLLDREPLAEGAVAIQPPRRGARVYFAHALRGKLLVGTGHAPLPPDSTSTTVPDDELDAMLVDLNAAAPSLGVGRADLLEVLAGQLPVQRPMSTDLCTTAKIVRHADFGGPGNAMSVAGVKFTTARSTAESALARFTETNIL